MDVKKLVSGLLAFAMCLTPYISAAQVNEVELPPVGELPNMELAGFSDPTTGMYFSSVIMSGHQFDVSLNINSGAMQISRDSGPVAYFNLGTALVAAGLPSNYVTQDRVFSGSRDRYLEVWPRDGGLPGMPQFDCAFVSCEVERQMRGDIGSRYKGPQTGPQSSYPDHVWQADYSDWSNWRNNECTAFQNNVVDSYLELPIDMAACATNTLIGNAACGGIIVKKTTDARRNMIHGNNCKSGYYGPGNWNNSRYPRVIVGQPNPYNP